MEKNLISEVLRIQELIGTQKKPIILEQAPLLRSIMGDEFETIVKSSLKGKGTTTLQSLEKKLAKLRSTTDDVVAAGLEDDILKLVDKDKLAQNIISKNLLPNMVKVEKGLVGSIKNGTVKADDAIARMNKVLDNSTAITNPELRDSMKRYYEKTFKRAGSEYEQIVAQKIETDFIEQLSKEQADAAAKLANEKGATSSVGALKNTFQKIENVTTDGFLADKGHRALFNRFKTNLDKLKQQDINFLNSLQKGEVDDMWAKLSANYPSQSKIFRAQFGKFWNWIPSPVKWLLGVLLAGTVGSGATIYFAKKTKDAAGETVDTGKEVIKVLTGDSTKTQSPVVQPPVTTGGGTPQVVTGGSPL